MGNKRGTNDSPRKLGKALLSLLLSITMAVGTIPTPALAEAIDEFAGEEEVVALDDQAAVEEAEPEEPTAEEPAAEEAAPEEAEPEAEAEVEALADEAEPEEVAPETLYAEAPGETYAPGGKANNDDLLDAYAQQRIDETLPEDKREGEVEALGQAEPVGNSLEGADKAAYDALVPLIKQVAAGERTSTEFEVPVSALTSKSEWTADELGTDIVVDGAITDEAIDVAYASFAPNLSVVNDALLADYPFALYWFDKTAGITTSQLEFGASGYGTDWVLTFDTTQSITYSFAVARGYAASTYEVNTSQADRIDAALADAQSVVNDHESDALYDRLDAYKDAICDRVTYDHDAAAGDVDYGDPWQLISVFDGDGNTNVVCEGYSKAFKYLCDLSSQGGGEAITVTGGMDGGTGAGPHMWNVVKMDDGRNYLVDVTNCDEGSVGHGQDGAQDELFVAIPTSGSVEDGYVFAANGTSISYTYDDDMASTYGEDAITYSTEAYDPEGSGSGEDKIDFGDSNWSALIDFPDGSKITYTGDPVVLPEVQITLEDESAEVSYELVLGEDFVIDHFEDGAYNEIETPSETGLYYVVFRGIGKYTGTLKAYFVIVPHVEAVDLSLDEDVNVSATIGSYWLGRFTAPEDGDYVFQSTGDSDTYGHLYSDEALEDEIASDDDGGDDNNFRIAYHLDEGQTLYLKVRQINNEAFTATVRVNKYDSNNISDEGWECCFANDNVVEYTGSAVSLPEVRIYRSVDGDDEPAYLVEGTDFKLDHIENADGDVVSDAIQVGKYVAVYRGIVNYSGTVRLSFQIREGAVTHQITSENFDEFESAHPYEDNSDITWTYTADEYSEYGWAVTLSDDSATEATWDIIYALDAEGNTVGQYDGAIGGTTINIPVAGNSFSLKLTSDGSSTAWGFKVIDVEPLTEEIPVDDSYDLSSYVIELTRSEYTWSGNAIYPYVDRVYDPDADAYVYDGVYALVYYDEEMNELDEAPSEVGTYYVAARAQQGSGYKNETQKAEFRIVGTNDISGELWIACYRGNEQYIGFTNEPVVLPQLYIYQDDWDMEDSLVYGTDFEFVRYEDLDDNEISAPSAIGAYQAVYQGVGNYTGTVKIRFEIVDPHDLQRARLELEADPVVLVGGVAEPVVTVYDILGNEVAKDAYTLHYYTLDWVEEEDADGNIDSYERRRDLDGAPTETGEYYVYAKAVDGGGYTGESYETTFTVADASNLRYANIHMQTNEVPIVNGVADVNIRVADAAGNELEESKHYTLHYYQEVEEWVDDEIGMETVIHKLDGAPTAVGEYYVYAEAVDGCGYSGTTGAYGFSVYDPYDIGYNSWLSYEGSSVVPYNNGNPVEPPVVHIYKTNTSGEDILLKEGKDKDYMLDHLEDAEGNTVAEATEIGSYYLVFKGVGNYTGERRVSFEVIDPNDIGTGYWRYSFENGQFVPYNGGAAVELPEVSVYRYDDNDEKIVLQENIDYVFDHLEDSDGNTVAEATNIDYYYLVLRGISDYSGELRAYFEVVDSGDLNYAHASWNSDVQLVNGEAPIALTLTDLQGNELTEGTHYTFEYYELDDDYNATPIDGVPSHAGRFGAMAKGVEENGYHGTTSLYDFNVYDSYDIGYESWLSYDGSSAVPYNNGNPVEPPAVRIYKDDANGDDILLEEGEDKDYVLDHIEDEDGHVVTHATAIGGYYLVFKGVGNYSGELRARFDVADPHDLRYASFNVYTYNVRLDRINSFSVEVTDVAGNTVSPDDYDLVYFERDDDLGERIYYLEDELSEGRWYSVAARAREGSSYTGETNSYEDINVYGAYDIGYDSIAAWRTGERVAYTGEAVVLPEPMVFKQDDEGFYTALAENEDYEFSSYERLVEDDYGDSTRETMSESPSEIGSYYAVYTGVAPYTGEIRIAFEIVDPADMPAEDDEGDPYDISSNYWNHRFEIYSTVPYTGEPIETPELLVYHVDDDDDTFTHLTQGTEYDFVNFYSATTNEDGDYVAGDVISAPTEPGAYFARYEGKAPYTGTFDKWFAINDVKNLANCGYQSYPAQRPYTGKGQKPNFVVYNPYSAWEETLVEGVDYEVVYYTTDGDGNKTYLEGLPTEVGTYRMYARTIEGSEYTGKTGESSFTIYEAGDMSFAWLSWVGGDVYTYTGNPVVPEVVVYRGYQDAQTKLVAGTDYILEYRVADDETATWLPEAPTEPGTYSVRATGRGDYSGSTSAESYNAFMIVKIPSAVALGLGTLQDAAAEEDAYWVGSFTAPEAGAYEFYSTGGQDTYGELYGDAELGDYLASNDDSGSGSNFKLGYALEAGQTVYLKVRQYGYEELSCKVGVKVLDAHDLSYATITRPDTPVPCYNDGAPLNMQITVRDASGAALTEGVDYELVYAVRNSYGGTYYTVNERLESAPTEEGDYAVVARAKEGSAYTGKTESLEFSVQDGSDLRQGYISLERNTFGATGSPIVPVVTVTNMLNEQLTEGKDYELVYAAWNSKWGKYDLIDYVPSEPGVYGVAARAIDGSGYTGRTWWYWCRINKVARTSIEGAEITLSQTSYTYDGTAKTPEVTVKYGDKTLEEGTDYELSWAEDRTNAGEVTVTVTGIGKYSESVELTYVILPAQITSVTGAKRAMYSGAAIEQSKSDLTVRAGNLTLSADDYELTYANNVNAGTATVFVNAKGNFAGELSQEFTIEQMSVAGAHITGIPEKAFYIGEAIEPTVSVKLGDFEVLPDDYEVTYANNVNAGTASVTVTGKGNLTGDFTQTFQIEPANLASAKVTAPTQTYTGEELAPQVSVVLDGKTLTEGDDYTVALDGDLVNAGTVGIIVTGKGNYTGTATGSFGIEQASIEDAKITAENKTYTGEVLTTQVRVEVGGKLLEVGTDYNVNYVGDHTNAGVARFTVHGLNNYKSQVQGTFRILPAAITSVDDIADAKYTGKAVKPEVTVRAGDIELAASDYDVTYENNTEVGNAAKVTVVAKGNFTGTITKTFAIVQEPSDPDAEGSVFNELATEYEDAQQAAEDAERAVADAEEELEAAQQALEAAQNDETYQELQQAAKDAADELETAEADRDAKKTAAEKAQAAVDAKQGEIDEAETDLAAKQTTASEKATAVTNAQNAVEAAETELKAANTAVEEAQAAVDAALAEAAEKAAEGSYGFFQSVGATEAIDVLTNCTYASYNKKGEAADATSLDNMKAAINWMKELNTIRSGLGLSELKVTDLLMAMSQANANYSDAIIGHSGQFFTSAYMAKLGNIIGENAAWNFGTSPYRQWFDEEKSYFDAAYLSIEGTGATVPTGAAAYNWYSAHDEAVEEYLAENYNGESVGHYINDITPGFATSGFGVCTRGTNYPYTHLQVFGGTVSTSYTVAEYEERFMEYYNSLLGDQVAAAEKAALAEAQATQAQKQQAYDDAVATRDAAETAKTEADAAVESAENNLVTLAAEKVTLAATASTAQTAYQSAQNVVNAKQEASDKANADLNAYDHAAVVAEAEAAVTAAEQKLEQAQNAKVAADERVAATQEALEASRTFTDQNVMVTGVGDVTYNGQAQTQPNAKLLLTMDGANGSETYELNKVTDYKVEFIGDTTNVGSVTMKFTAIGDTYKGSTVATFQITPAQITGIDDIANDTYAGKAIEPELTVRAGDLTLAAGDYDATYENNTNAGTATVKVAGKGNFAGEATASFYINKASIADATVSVAAKSYTGEALEPSVSVKLGGVTLSADDYEVEAKGDRVVPGTYQVTVRGKGNLEGEVTKDFVVRPKSLADSMVTLNGTFTYDGAEHRPEVAVTDGTKHLVEGTDYELSWPEDCTSAGTHGVTVTGKGNYTGTASAGFEIARKAVTPTVALSAASYVYNGKVKTPTVTVKDGTKTLVEDKDYAVTWPAGRKAVGSYTVKVTLKGNYSGSGSKAFKIVPGTPTTTVANAASGVTVKWTKAAGATGYYVYRKTGSGSYARVRTVTSSAAGSWTDTAVKTKNGTTYAYYVVAYGGADNNIVGNKKAVSIVRLTSLAAPGATNLSGRKAKFTWKRNTKATGYQVQWSTSSTFASGNTTKSITKNTTLAFTATGLTKGKTYYVRVRSYKKVGTRTFYSAWSSKRAVKITK